MRRLFLLVLCGGCDLVITLDPPNDAVCGPYKSITPVPFSSFLEAPRDFSISYDPTIGMVYAKIQISTTETHTGPVPIKLDADGTWKPDRVTNIKPQWGEGRASGAHILGDGTAFVWRDQTTQTAPSLIRFAFTSAWNQTTTEGPLDNDLSRNFFPGNEIVLPIDNGQLRFFVEVRTAFTGAEKNRILIRQKFAETQWVDTAQASLIADRMDIDPSAAVMTLDHQILVYAARVNGEKSRIYASRRSKADDKFLIGELVDLASVGDLDETEPWIAQDCTTLYFRRGGITYRAQ